MSKGGKPRAGTRLVIARFPVPGRKVWPRPVKHKACGFPVNHPYATLVMRKAKHKFQDHLHEKTSVEKYKINEVTVYGSLPNTSVRVEGRVSLQA
jgi:hypothetical protein